MKERVERVLRRLNWLRHQLELVEDCLDLLNLEDKMVLEHFYMDPGEELAQLCDSLQLEKSSVYRRKYRALQKIGELFEEYGVALCRDDF